MTHSPFTREISDDESRTLLVHAAPGNQTSDTRRRAYTARWAGDDVTFFPRAGLQEMPPVPPELQSGDPLDSELWPRIFG